MKFYLILFALLLLPAVATAGVAGEAADGSCVSCHAEKTPGAVNIWKTSAHAGAGVGCAECHGNDHGRLEKGEGLVDHTVCGRCHAEALNQHLAGRHAIALHAAWGCTRNHPEILPRRCEFCHEGDTAVAKVKVQCARFLKQSPEMGELGCNRCHQVENSCASCHTNHGTELRIVRDPAVCAKCHMGPDHPQWEMWRTSMHGTLYYSAGPEVGPSCQTCHMPAGTHDVSGGLTATPGNAILAEREFAAQRDKMVRLCLACHAERFARQELERGDAIRTQSLALTGEARAIIADLADRGLLDPMPADRPPHPHVGHRLVLDGQMLYEDISHIERLYFKMMKFDLAKTIKGGYHQNPAYTHWYGNAELKMDLVDIRSEASRLGRRPGAASGAAGPESGEDFPEPEKALELLRNQYRRGTISAEEYEEKRKQILDGLLEMK